LFPLPRIFHGFTEAGYGLRSPFSDAYFLLFSFALAFASATVITPGVHRFRSTRHTMIFWGTSFLGQKHVMTSFFVRLFVPFTGSEFGLRWQNYLPQDTFFLVSYFFQVLSAL
jgi:hypothetical protein